MTQEDKDLLLKDLSARWIYGVKVETEGIPRKLFPMDLVCDEIPRPYLRPMSSMTEDEYAEFSTILHKWFDDELFYLTEEPFIEYALSVIGYSVNPILFDWLNAHHFDYRGLIEKGLALEAPEGMYKN